MQARSKTTKIGWQPGRKDDGKEKKHCHAFNFGKSMCRYGAKCRFLHEKGKQGGNGKQESDVPGFSPQQKKLVSAMVSPAIRQTAKHIAKKNKTTKGKPAKGKAKESSDDESGPDYAEVMASCFLAPIKNTIKRDFVSKKCNAVMLSDLHSVEKNCGIDSDAGISISTLREDFIWLDETDEAKNSIQSPAGINGGTSSIGGRGPMCVRASSGEYLLDPDAVYLKGGDNQPNFRVLSTQRLKIICVRIVGCFKGSDIDVLQDRLTKRTIELSEEGPTDKKILVLNTVKIPEFGRRAEIKKIVDDIRKRNRSAMVVEMEDISAEGEAIVDAELQPVLSESNNDEFPVII